MTETVKIATEIQKLRELHRKVEERISEIQKLKKRVSRTKGPLYFEVRNTPDPADSFPLDNLIKENPSQLSMELTPPESLSALSLFSEILHKRKEIILNSISIKKLQSAV